MIVCASDLHIGYAKTDYSAIHRALDMIESDKENIELLILNGDIIDLWRCKYKKLRSTKLYNDAFEHLQEVTNVVKTIYLRGNHDYYADKIIGNDLNVEYKRIFIHKNICYLHGDNFSLLQIKSLSAFLTRRGHFISNWLDYQPNTNTISNHIIKRILDFNEKNFFEYIVLGHLHYSGIHKNIIFCGDAIHHPTLIEITDESIRIKKV